MSASRMPTRKPFCWKPSARLTAVVDLPTPPLPEATAIMYFTRPMPLCLRAGVGRSAAAAFLLGVGGQRDDGVGHARQRLHRVLRGLAQRLVSARLGLRNVQREIDLIFVDDDFRKHAGGDEIAAAGRCDGLKCVEHAFFGRGLAIYLPL